MTAKAARQMYRMDADPVGNAGNGEVLQVSVMKELNGPVQPARWSSIVALHEPIHAPEQLVTQGIQRQAAGLHGATPGNSHCDRELCHVT
jgi:hypothetical protein